MALLGVCPGLWSQTNELAVGDNPPPLDFATLLQAPNGARASWPALKDKVVVLEFWATWCMPCIQAIPHLNEMADALKDAPVQFIAITEEQAEIVTPFLQKRPIHAWIGLSASKSMLARYGVTAIPRTVVVDRAGRVAAIAGPGDLSQQSLRDLAAGKPLALPPQNRRDVLSFRPGELPEASGKVQPDLFRVLIRPSESLTSGWGGSPGKFTFIGVRVLNMLCAAYDVDETRIIAKSELPVERFDAVVNVPSREPDAGRNWLRLAVEGTFKLRGRRETREMEALVLTVTNPRAEHLTVASSTGGSSSHSDADSGQIQSMNMPISSVVGNLQDLLKTPVIDETGLTNHYDWTLNWDAKSSPRSSTEALRKAVREQLGLELAPARRPIEVIVVDKTS